MVTYVNYVAGTTKGETNAEDLFNNPFRLGDAEYDAATGTYGASGPVDSRYTSNAVIETVEANQSAFMWTPVCQGSFVVKAATPTTPAVVADVKIGSGADAIYGTFASEDNAKTGTFANMTFVDADGEETSHTVSASDKVAYRYDNIVIPQEKLPTLKAEMKSIPLLARARRIAIYYSQIAA